MSYATGRETEHRRAVGGAAADRPGGALRPVRTRLCVRTGRARPHPFARIRAAQNRVLNETPSRFWYISIVSVPAAPGPTKALNSEAPVTEFLRAYM